MMSRVSATLTNAEFRAAKRALRETLHAGKRPSPHELHDAAITAQAYGRSGVRPRPRLVPRRPIRRGWMRCGPATNRSARTSKSWRTGSAVIRSRDRPTRWLRSSMPCWQISKPRQTAGTPSAPNGARSSRVDRATSRHGRSAAWSGGSWGDASLRVAHLHRRASSAQRSPTRLVRRREPPTRRA